MPLDYALMEERLNAIAAEIPLLEKTDFAPLNAIMTAISEISESRDLPAAFITQIQRTISLIETIILGGVEFSSGVLKLGQSVEKMLKEAGNPHRRGCTESDAPERAPETTAAMPAASTPVPADAPASSPPTAFEGDRSLLTDFVNEARDHITGAETLLLELETNPADSERIDAVFRSWHTVKGVAGFLNLKEIQKLAHSMESVMDRVRKGECTLSAHAIDVLLESNDCLKAYIANVEIAIGGAPLTVPDNYESLLVRLSALDLQKPQDTNHPPEEKKKLGEILVQKGVVTREMLDEALLKQKKGDARKIGEILVHDNNVSPLSITGAMATQSNARSSTVIEESIRVPVGRIDQLVDAIGEAVIAQSMIYADKQVVGIADQAVQTKIGHASMIMRQIQEMAMSLRMVSVRATFQKMARLARDLAKKCGREIELITEGEETELDKSVVEKIGDPLIHMIRNSVDHGIESPAYRALAGKPARAMVKLRAYHRAGNIYIEVSDDGRGLDREAIRKKAIEKGLCKPEEHLTDEAVYRFIFLPGFSTAKKVTDISGRGVGMDVVLRNIEALRGSVEIVSNPGKGTTFSIRLPLTLAIVDGMIVRAGGEQYIVPTLAIIESLRPQEGQIESVMQRGAMIKVRNDLIPIVNLSALFTRKHVATAQDSPDGVVMIVEDMLGKKIGLHLDDIVGQQQVVIKSLGEELGEIAGITGGAIMSDGSVSLILDVGGIVKMVQG
jgi:two-component system chemotaxis sensor kinase CheA